MMDDNTTPETEIEIEIVTIDLATAHRFDSTMHCATHNRACDPFADDEDDNS